MYFFFFSTLTCSPSHSFLFNFIHFSLISTFSWLFILFTYYLHTLSFTFTHLCSFPHICTFFSFIFIHLHSFNHSYISFFIHFHFFLLYSFSFILIHIHLFSLFFIITCITFVIKLAFSTVNLLFLFFLCLFLLA